MNAWLDKPESKDVLVKNGKKGWEGLTEEEHKQKAEKLKTAKENRTPEQKAIASKNNSEAQKKYNANLTEEQKINKKNASLKAAQTVKNKTPEQKEASRLKKVATREANWAKLTDEEKEAVHKKRSEASTKSNLAIQARKRLEKESKSNQLK